MITIVDYHAGNIGSIRNMLLRLGHDSVITHDQREISNASHIILPGVGSFDYGMSKLSSLGLLDILNKKVMQEGTPVLGICLGAQLMFDESEEGQLQGLHWIPGKVKKFNTEVGGKKFPVPHIGWEQVTPLKQSKALDGLTESRFYFVHSYYIACEQRGDALTETEYGVPFDSSFERRNILGMQFHPEKSHTYGKTVLNNFITKY